MGFWPFEGWWVGWGAIVAPFSSLYPSWMVEVARYLSTYYWLVLLGGGLWAVWRRREVLKPLIATLLANQVVVEVLKRLTREVRPNGGSFDSFPSGHTAACFALATVLTCYFPRWGWGWFAFASLVGASRVIMRAHWWHDVIGGAALGCLIAWLLLRFRSLRLSLRQPGEANLSAVATSADDEP